MLNVDLSNVWGQLSLSDLMGMEKRLNEANVLLRSDAGRGSSLGGFLEAPACLDTDDLRRVEAAAGKIGSGSASLLVIGSGGAYMAARGLTGLLEAKSGCELVFTGDHFSSSSYLKLAKQLENRDFSIIVVSKPDPDMSVSLAFRFFKRILEHKYGMEAAKSRIYITTSAGEGYLPKIAELESYELFLLPKGTETRFGALSLGCLLPAAVAGLDFRALYFGGVEAMKALELASLDNPAWQYAALRALMAESGKGIELLSCVDKGFRPMGRWWQQLFSGTDKNGRGIFPAYAQYPADYDTFKGYLAGGSKLFETALHFEPELGELLIEVEWQNLDGLNHLSGKPLRHVEDSFFRDSLAAHESAGLPVIVINPGHRAEKELGALLYFFELARGLSLSLTAGAERALPGAGGG